MAAEHFNAYGWGRADQELHDLRPFGDEMPELYQPGNVLEERGVTRLKMQDVFEKVEVS